MTTMTHPRAATFALPSADRPCLTVGCAPCQQQTSVGLTLTGIEQARRFLRQHAPCLADL